MWDWFTNFLTWVLEGIADFVGDYGLAVIILTVIIRLILTPLMTKSSASNARVQAMQPKLQEIQERYADDPVKQSEELRKVYSSMNYNPMTGCLPMLLQLPIFFGLFSVVQEVPEDASFFNILPSISMSVSEVIEASGWVEAIPYIIFDVAFGVLTFIPMFLNLKNQPEEQRTTTLVTGIIMSLLMLWFGWSCPAAVLLYYVTSSTWQLIQQQLITKRVMDKAKAEAEEAMRQASPTVEVTVDRREKKKRPHKKSKK